jgi:hypothetical protein
VMSIEMRRNAYSSGEVLCRTKIGVAGARVLVVEDIMAGRWGCDTFGLRTRPSRWSVPLLLASMMVWLTILSLTRNGAGGMIERVPAAQSSMKMITRNFILSEMERIVVVYVIGGLWCCWTLQ